MYFFLFSKDNETKIAGVWKKEGGPPTPSIGKEIVGGMEGREQNSSGGRSGEKSKRENYAF